MKYPKTITTILTIHILLSFASIIAYHEVYYGGRGYFEHWYDYLFGYYGMFGFGIPIAMFGSGLFIVGLWTAIHMLITGEYKDYK